MNVTKTKHFVQEIETKEFLNTKEGFASDPELAEDFGNADIATVQAKFYSRFGSACVYVPVTVTYSWETK